MEQLNRKTLDNLGYQGYLLNDAAERVLQFGEGNFLRAFADYFIDIANEKCDFRCKVVVAQPIQYGLAEELNKQDGLYTLYLRGFQDGSPVNQKRIVSCISRAINPYSDYQALLAVAENPELRYIVSNTTEAGIVFDDSCRFDDAPPASFPAKLTRFLYQRYKTEAAKENGLVVLSCELIDNNGEELQRCVEQYLQLWKLEEEFSRWLHRQVSFHSTLVDRIVTGYPANEAEKLNAENGYEDKLLDTGEIFGLWVIEGPESLEQELPFAKAGLPVKVVPDHTPYKQRKVRILNGAHTSLVPVAYLCGKDIVRDCMEDPQLRRFMETTIYDEVIPTLQLPKTELEEFAASVTDRFSNPFIDHALLSIALNSVSKWRARVMPSLKVYLEDKKTLPSHIVFSFAALLAFYQGEKLRDEGMEALRNGSPYLIKDDRWVLEAFMALKGKNAAETVTAIAGNTRMWGEDLNNLPGFADSVTNYLSGIQANGMRAALDALQQEA